MIEFRGNDQTYTKLVVGTDIHPHPSDEYKYYCANTSNRFDKISALYTYYSTYAVIDTLNDWRSFNSGQKIVGSEEIGSVMDSVKDEFPLRVMLKKFHLIKPG